MQPGSQPLDVISMKSESTLILVAGQFAWKSLFGYPMLQSSLLERNLVSSFSKTRKMVFLFLSVTTWVLLGCIIVLYICYDMWCRGYWARHGIRSPPSQLILGNTYQWRKGQHDKYVEYRKKYGNFFGVYNFNEPILVVSDLDVVRNILVKDFNYFYNRRNPPLANRPMDKSLFFLQDTRWKEVRNVTTPTFSANKMKRMSVVVNKSADRLVENFGKEQDKNGFVECRELYGSFIMDSTTSCAFGLEVDSQGDPDHPFVAHAKKTFTIGFVFNPLILLVALFPWTSHILRYFDIGLLSRESIKFFRKISAQAIALRRATTNTDHKRVDFLQLVIDASKQTGEDKADQKEPEDDIHNDIEAEQDVSDSVSRNSKKTVLDNDEVTAQALFFFLGGYETTSSLCAFSSYLLAMNPETQDKLLEEIDEMAPTAECVNYSTIAKMTYLDQVVRETLRLYPIGPSTNRMCKKEYEINGFTVPKGMEVQIPIFTIHRDPEHWPEPDKFIPERFTKENTEKRHPYAWIPFGSGPRTCIGMRFAMMEAKIALVRVLREFRFETCPQTEIPPTLGALGFLTPPNGVTLRAVRRS